MNLLLALLLAVPAAASSSSGSGASAGAQQEYLRGTLLERRGAYAEALEAYEKALALDPGSAFLAGEAADLALELEDWSRAERWARRRLELAPTDGKSAMILARVFWSRGQEDEAVKEFEAALKLDAASIDAIMALTELIAPKDPKRARAMLERFLAANPEHAAKVLHELAKLDAQESRYAAAVEKLRRAISLDEGESDPVRLTLGQVFEISHDTAAAVAEYRKVMTSIPDDYELWAHVAELEAARGDAAAARAEFLSLKEKRPDDASAAAWLASDAERAGDFAKAAGYLKDSSALKDDPTLHLRLGYYQLQSGGVREAMRTLKEARKRWPKDDRIAYYLALGHDDLGERAEAAALLREVLALKPDDRDARWQLATILEKMDKMAEAEPEFRALIASKPDDAPALNYLGYALADRGLKLTEAEGLIRGALALEPGNAAYRDSLGWALFKQGRSTEAVVELQASARAIADDESLWDHLGAAHQAVGDAESAWLAWRLAQSLGGAKAGEKAEALQKGLSDEALAELWRRHLEAVQGGVKKTSGLCELKGRIAGRPVSRQALFTFRAPREVSFELLGPMFSTVWRARLDARGFSMDPFPVEGLDQGRVEEAAQGAFAAIAAALSGDAFAPGPARIERGWGRTSLMRPAWRIDLEDGLARSISPAGNGVTVSLSDFMRARARQVPRIMETKGRFWELAISCPEPKAEFNP
ncbi:MAG: tetratricopeptide repeat protein [Elusimicrobia bacterium]|nr:tetratricopeptide repeat protein [Elusimicrobiota bacterium]